MEPEQQRFVDQVVELMKSDDIVCCVKFGIVDNYDQVLTYNINDVVKYMLFVKDQILEDMASEAISILNIYSDDTIIRLSTLIKDLPAPGITAEVIKYVRTFDDKSLLYCFVTFEEDKNEGIFMIILRKYQTLNIENL